MEQCVMIGAGAIGGMLADFLEWQGPIVVGRASKDAVYRDLHGVPILGDGPAGLANIWHNVISLRESLAVDEELTARLLYHFFGVKEDLSVLRNWNFVPYRPFRPRIRTHSKILADPVVRIVDNGSHLEILLTSGRVLRSRNAVLAAGMFRSLELLRASDLIPEVRDFHNHVVGYGGQVDRDHVSERLVLHSRAGVFFHEHCYSSDTSVTVRPSRFGFDSKSAVRHQTVYTSTNVARIVANIAASGSLGLISEALFNRFGLFGSAKHYNLWVQRRIRVSVNSGTTALEAARQYQGESFSGTVNGVAFDVPTPVSGIHFHGGVAHEQLESEDNGRTYSLCKGKLLLATPIDDRHLYSGHHTFALVARYAPRVRTMLSEN